MQIILWLVHLHDTQIGEVMHECTVVSLGASRLIPLFVQGDAMSTIDLHWSQELRDLETGRKDNYVKFVLNTGRSDNSGFGEFLDSLVAKLHISLMK